MSNDYIFKYTIKEINQPRVYVSSANSVKAFLKEFYKKYSLTEAEILFGGLEKL